MRRLLGPVGGPVLFFLVAALVFAGLGWLTVVALRVEKAQREAAAQAELGNNLRVALWQLDGRVLLQLGGEDARPYYHYSSADPQSGSTAGPTPLLGAPLPDWMKLHVQLDPATGWESPQVLAPEARERVEQVWPDLSLRNNTQERAAALHRLRERYPAGSTCGLFAARDRAIPENSPPFAAPLFTTDSLQQSADPVAAVPPASAPKPPPPPELGPTPAPPTRATSDALKLFGWEFRNREALAGNSRSGAKPEVTIHTAPAPPLTPPGPVPPAPQSGQGAVPQAPLNGRGGFARVPENDRGRDDFWNRAQTIQKASQEAKGAGSDPRYGNYQNPVTNGDLRNSVLPAPPAPGGPPGAGAAPGLNNEKTDKDARIAANPPGKPAAPGDFDKFKELLLEQAKLAKDANASKGLRAEKPRDSLTERLAALRSGLERQRCLDEVEDQCRRQAERHPLLAAAWSIAGAAGCALPPQPVPPAEERPLPAFALNTLNNLTLNNALVPFPVVNIHLGSMRPQWITAADGTELLVLVRVAKLDNRTVYQGVVLDWDKLEQLLKDEVRELFPDARLVPVKNPDGVLPARAMTALPVQLDPGPEPELPPAGLTPLRLGLVLAWIAAFIAFAAVGLSGWSLIDLAERRIRFVSAVTHELRTPLTSLRLYLDLLTSGMIHDEAKRQEYLSTLAVESDRLHRLVDNVLDFAKLEKRRKNGDLKPVRVAELLAFLQQTWADRIAADGKELVVISTLPPDLEVCTDPAMVQQIVGNLIDNARKYARDAADKRIWLWAKPDGVKRVVLEVEDRGAGVPANERKTIFKPFRRGASADTTAGGAGLGLALAKQWAEVLGGTVAYRPAEGAPGACFRLELPNK